MKIILYASFLLTLLIGSYQIRISNLEVSLLRQTYGLEAIKVLALDAALTFPTVKEEPLGVNYWPRLETPCVFTTNTVQRTSNNASTVNWQNWPSGDTLSCSDFYVGISGAYDPSTTLPSNCSPAITMHDINEPQTNFVVAVAKDVNSRALLAADISLETTNRLKNLGRFSSYAHTTDFIRSGGFDEVTIDRVSKEECDSLTLFRYQTEVKRPLAMRSNLEANG
ncbi:MAG: hypothetical protein ABJN38_11895 [Lentilitoribacter sp.]